MTKQRKTSETFSRVQVIRKGPDVPVNKQPGFRREDVVPEIPPLDPHPTQETQTVPEALQQTPPPRVIDRSSPTKENLEPHVGGALRTLEGREKEAEKLESQPVAKDEIKPVAKSSIDSPATKQPAQGRALNEARPLPAKKTPAKKTAKKKAR
jgi:hypothetical protein